MDSSSELTDGPDGGVLDAEERAFLTNINAYRRGLGLGLGLRKLRVSIALSAAAKVHSADMAANNKMSHTSSDGTDMFTRIKRYYNYNTYLGECVAYGYSTGATVFTGWKSSPGHDAIMRGSAYTVIGIARVAAANGTWYWTTTYGGYTDAVLSAGFGTIAANGGFESNSFATASFGSVRTLSKWHLKTGGSGGVARTTSATSGTYGLRLRDVSVDANGNGVSTSATQVVRATAGINYRVSAKARRAGGPSYQTVYLDFLDGNFQRRPSGTFTVRAGTTTTFTKTSVEEKAPSGTKYVRIILWASGAVGQASTYDYDEVKLEAW